MLNHSSNMPNHASKMLNHISKMLETSSMLIHASNVLLSYLNFQTSQQLIWFTNLVSHLIIIIKHSICNKI